MASTLTTKPSADEALLLSMRRHKRLLKAYKGAQPADRGLKRELEWAVEAFISDDEARMRKMTERLNASLPPVGMSDARARRLGIARVVEA
jgi:hypothetical protein